MKKTRAEKISPITSFAEHRWDAVRARVVLPRLLRLINSLEPAYQGLSDNQLQAKTAEFRSRREHGESLDELLPEAFALVRETARRKLGERHYDVQIIGGIVLHTGCIAEMQTGEGKTLVATLPAYLNALTGKGVHMVTVNDYLARRDAEWMGPIFHALGLTVGVIQHSSSWQDRFAAYRCDITYGTNKEYGFDYLRDRLRTQVPQKDPLASPLEHLLAEMQTLREDFCQRPHHYAIVDEVDSILIDEARTPLIISGPGQASTERATYQRADWLAKQLQPETHFDLYPHDRQVEMIGSGLQEIRRLVERFLPAGEHKTDWEKPVELALRARHLYHRDREYLIQDGKVLIVDEFTGRTMPGRQWSEGLHPAIEAKEGLAINVDTDSLARTTYQTYFRLYEKLAGMTGTAATQAREFRNVFNLRVVVNPTNRPLRRDLWLDRVFATEEEKFAAVCEEIVRLHTLGRPVLVGTRSIEKSELLSDLLKQLGIEHEVLNAKNHETEAKIVALAGQPGRVTIATNMAGRGTDIKLGPGVAELGGLHVIATERHESRRIDNQLIGRAGRQGDPGSGQFFVSLEDELIQVHNPDNAERFAYLFSINQPWRMPLARWFFTRTQRKVEVYHSRIRRSLLKYDEFLNKAFHSLYGIQSS